MALFEKRAQYDLGCFKECEKYEDRKSHDQFCEESEENESHGFICKANMP